MQMYEERLYCKVGEGSEKLTMTELLQHTSHVTRLPE